MNNQTIRVRRLILIIWAVWSLVVALSNIFDALRNLGIIPSGFKFVSGNFGYIQAATSIYSLPVWIDSILFAIVIIWEALMAYYFFKAFLNTSVENNRSILYTPFILGFALFGGFLIMDEILIAYDRLGSIEQNHFVIFAALMISLLTVSLLPAASINKKENS